jgi:hypothetical protein
MHKRFPDSRAARAGTSTGRSAEGATGLRLERRG